MAGVENVSVNKYFGHFSNLVTAGLPGTGVGKRCQAVVFGVLFQ